MYLNPAAYGGALELLYGAVMEPQQWERALERCADLLGAHNACLLDLDLHSGSGGGQGLLARIDPRMPKVYEEHYAQCNPLLHVSDVDAYLRNWSLHILTDEEWMAKEDLIRTEYYNDFLKPQGVHSCLMIRLEVRGTSVASLNINRPSHLEQFGRSEIEFANTLHPHILNAYTMSRQFDGIRRLSEDLSDALDLSPFGVFFLDDKGTIRYANRATERMVAGALGVVVKEGRLSAYWPQAAARLDGLLKAATAPEAELRRGGTMALPSPKRTLPLSLTVAPVTSERLNFFTRGRSVVVCISDLEHGGTLPEQSLRDLFLLTPAEARVAMALFEGFSPKEAAQNLGLSVNTVRVHMASIFSKTGTNRQSDLLRLLLRAVGTSIG